MYVIVFHGDQQNFGGNETPRNATRHSPQAFNSERIVVPSSGEPQIFHVVRGKIPSDLKTQLSAPLSEMDKNSIFNEVGLLSATSLPKQEKPKVLWLFGPPAAGKSTLASERTSELFGSNDFVCVDGDEIRDRHPAFRAVTQHGLESRVLHKDAWEILKETGCVEGLKKQILQKAIENRQNITMPDCALKPKRVMEMLKALQNADYEMHAICLWAPASEAERRGRVRSIQTGKAYSPKFHRPSREGTIEVAHYWEEMRQLNHHFQSIEYYDTTAQAGRKVVDLASFERLGAETELRRAETFGDPRESIKKPSGKASWDFTLTNGNDNIPSRRQADSQELVELVLCTGGRRTAQHEKECSMAAMVPVGYRLHFARHQPLLSPEFHIKVARPRAVFQRNKLTAHEEFGGKVPEVFSKKRTAVVPRLHLKIHGVIAVLERKDGRGKLLRPGVDGAAETRLTGKSGCELSCGEYEGNHPTIVEELTWARTRPQEVIEALEERLKNYRGKDYYPPERGGACVVTKEGVAVVQEAIDYVKSLEKLEGVGSESQQGLALAAADHIWDIGQTGTASHSSSDGTSAGERASRYGHFGSFGECLWYGSDKADARCVVLDLIVDDGVPSRGHRKGVLDPRYDTVGVAYGPHCTFGQMAAMEFARGWEPDADAVRARVESGPFKMSAEAMAAAKSKVETAWSLGQCPICRETIKGGKVVDVAEVGGKLHAGCFKCMACATSLVGGAFKVQARQPYCKTCFYEKFGETCKACSKVITGSMVSCALGKLHLECLICSACKKSIGKASFSTTDGAIKCQECSKAEPARKGGASGASKPLAGAGAAITGAAKAKPKAVAKVSMAKAKASAMGLAMDYAALG
ncbi:unnamed protein product [Cladocopium goreaui]|uniref:LIM zinc-binding domain-containing protein n=1 Tax=Cladocopium goreaui TaxID=2562237 RepID=A0A9P1FEE2_9DINO|nr:unnamed protein product [Cladocopium goreaui]